jgi:hypothetical protein
MLASISRCLRNICTSDTDRAAAACALPLAKLDLVA